MTGSWDIIFWVSKDFKAKLCFPHWHIFLAVLWIWPLLRSHFQRGWEFWTLSSPSSICFFLLHFNYKLQEELGAAWTTFFSPFFFFSLEIPLARSLSSFDTFYDVTKYMLLNFLPLCEYDMFHLQPLQNPDFWASLILFSMSSHLLLCSGTTVSSTF